MSLIARLHIEGHANEQKGIRVISSEFSFSQATDAKGRPTAKVKGGMIKLTILIEDDAEILNWMIFPDDFKNGEIVFMAGESKIKKKLEFKKAALISYVENFEDQKDVKVHLTISTESLIVAGADFSNEWYDPDE